MQTSVKPPTATESRSGQGWLASPLLRAALLGVLLAAATLLVYRPVTSHPFLNFDDALYVTDNLQVQGGLDWQMVTWAFTTYAADNWHPLTWISHAIDCQLFGLDPSGPHQVNVVLHALNALLLFWLLWRATGYMGRSFMVAALFALHPINVESVAWIAERKNLLSTLFFLLALAAYRWYASQPRVGRYAVVALLFAMGLMSKPQVITFPFVLLLWDYWPLQRMFAGGDESTSGTIPAIPAKSISWLILEKVPLLLLAMASAVITVLAQQEGGAIGTYIPPSMRIYNAIVSYARYLERVFWPSHLSVLYPYPGSIRPMQALAVLFFLLVVTVLVLEQRRRRRYLAVGWLWFLGTLVPMIGLVQVGNQAMADRYAYLPFLGLFIMICWGVADWAQQRHIANRWLVSGSLAVLIVLAAFTHRQITYWSGNVTLWSHAVAVTNQNWVAENNLGTALLQEGLSDQALAHFRAAVAIYPLDPLTNMNLAIQEQKHDNLRDAIEHYQRVIQLTQNDVQRNLELRHDAFYHMSIAYRDLGDSTNAAKAMAEATSIPQQYGQ
ncbi:MAG: tetratricopeptide repeat protein [Candidatus Korobacteraceae bacterium]